MHQDRTDLDPRAALVSKTKRDAVKTYYKRNGLEPKRTKDAKLILYRKTTQVVYLRFRKRPCQNFGMNLRFSAQNSQRSMNPILT